MQQHILLIVDAYNILCCLYYLVCLTA